MKLIESPATYFCSGTLSLFPDRLPVNSFCRFFGYFLARFVSDALILNFLLSEQPEPDGTSTGLAVDTPEVFPSVRSYLSVTVSLIMTALLFSPLRVIVSCGSAVSIGVVITAEMEN